MSDPYADSRTITMLLGRFERISADSIWAHRASSIRGTLIRIQDDIQAGHPPDPQRLTVVLSMAFRILVLAAKQR